MLADVLRSQADAMSGLTLLCVQSLWAALELDEILYELRECVDRLAWDSDGFLLSLVQTFNRFPEYILPDRADITPNTHCLRALAIHVATTGARRGVELAEESPLAADHVEVADFLLVPHGRITEGGIRERIDTALSYLCARADSGNDDLEPAAINGAELARAQLWQWVRHETGVLDEGRIITPALFSGLLDETVARRGSEAGIEKASEHLADAVLDPEFRMRAFEQ